MKFLIRDMWAQTRVKLALAMGWEKQSAPPYFINLEPTCFCNLKCPICSYDGSRKKGYISRETAELALKQAQELRVTEVRFFLAGEPFFHPHLAELIAQAKAYNLITLIHTNATYMPEARMQAVFDAGLDKISFSFDGETAEEYEKIRLGGKFEATLNNILHFLEIKKARGGKFPLVTIQVIKLHGKSDSGYISDEFKKKFAGLPVNEFILLYPYVWPGQEAQDFNRPHGHKYYPCKTPWTSLSLGWDGKVFWCCGDLNGKGILGDIHQNTLKEIWNGEKLRSMRRSFAKGDLKDLELCLQCEVPYHYVHPLFIDIREAIRQVKRYFK